MTGYLFRNLSLLEPAVGEAQPGMELRVVMPGPIGSHVHVMVSEVFIPKLESVPRTLATGRAAALMRGMIDRGFTTVRDTGGADRGMRRAVDEGSITGPQRFIAGRAIGPTGGHSDARQRTESGKRCTMAYGKAGLPVAALLMAALMAAAPAAADGQASAAATAPAPAPAAVPAPVLATAPEGTLTPVVGRFIRDPDGNDVGRVWDVLVDANGVPQAAVIDYGGVLGIGKRKVAVAWSALKFGMTSSSDDVTLALTKEQMGAIPDYKYSGGDATVGGTGEER